MKIITCLKPVPDPASRLFVNEEKTWIKDRELTFVTSEADTHGIEEALRLREGDSGEGEVVVLSVGGGPAARTLRGGLAMGADRAIQLLDEAFDKADEWLRARLIARAVEKDGGADLLITGVQSDDLNSGVTGIMAAELLGWSHASVVVGVESNDGSLQVQRELEGGRTETLSMTLPAVLTIQFGINQPRYASLKGIMAAKKKELKVWDRAALEIPDEELQNAAGYRVVEVFVPERESQVELLSGSPAEMAAQLIERLRKDGQL